MSNNLATGQKDSIFSAFCSAALYKENKKMFFKKCTILLFIFWIKSYSCIAGQSADVSQKTLVGYLSTDDGLNLLLASSPNVTEISAGAIVKIEGAGLNY